MAKCNSKKEIVENNIDNIKKWISEGQTIESIAKALKVSKTTLYKYIGKDGLATLDDIKKNRAPAVNKLENTMFKAGCGYTRKVKKYIKVKSADYKDGKKIYEWEDVKEVEEEVYYPPDMTACIFLLKNWGKYMNEPRLMELRKKEIDLKESQMW